MKKIITFITLFAIFSSVLAQKQTHQNEKYRLITGIRVNPVIIYDLKGNNQQKVLLHTELGVLLKKKFYTSIGYTPAVNALYNFNEYWFIGFDKKLPVSWVLAEAYNFNMNTAFIQTGFNFKLSKIGNFFAFVYSPTNQLNLGLKMGVFIPLNLVLKQK